jgi:translation initiation factor 2 subunit 1
MEVAVVLHVDNVKGYIDLSKKKVTAEEILKCETKWNNAKWVHSVISRVAEQCSEDPELADWDLLRLSQCVTWPLSPHAYEALREGVALDVPPKLATLIQDNVRKRMQVLYVKIRADIDVMCYRYDGIDSIKEALRCGLAVDKDGQLSITLNKSPSYMVTLYTSNKEKGIALVKQACDAIVQQITKLGGSGIIQREAGVVGEEEEILPVEEEEEEYPF